MLTKPQKEMLDRLDRQASEDLKHGFDSAALHWQHVRDIARAGVTHDELVALFRGCYDDDVLAALIASKETPETIAM
jgi:hypothetical protein